MAPHTFLFFGRSGCGKGTQAKLLIEYLRKNDPEHRVLYVETGARLREFSQEVGISAKLTAKAMSEGGLLPSFLPIWIWTDLFTRNLEGSEHLVLDGLSRRVYEAPILDDALKFYKRPMPYILIINVPRDWAKKHLLSRGRNDDTEKDVDARLDWYDANVLPTIDYFRNNPYYTVLEINGEQPIEAVHKEILEKTKI